MDSWCGDGVDQGNCRENYFRSNNSRIRGYKRSDKRQIFHLQKKVLIDVVQQKNFESPMTNQIDKLVASYWSMDNLAQQMIGSGTMINHLLKFIVRNMDKKND